VSTETRDPWVGVFEPVERIRTRLSQLSHDGPSAGSRAARDARTKLGEMAWTLALPASTIGVDHLLAWKGLRLGASLQPAFSHWTLIRGAIEGNAVARWLCDPAIDGRERIQRAAGVQLADYTQRLSFERRIASRPAKLRTSGRTAEQRIAELERRLGRVVPIPMPSATDLFALYASVDAKEPREGERLFRAISGIAHAKVWSLFGMSELGERTANRGGGLVVRVGADEKLGLRATVVAMHVAADALVDIERYAKGET
jgi:hypothetical protein